MEKQLPATNPLIVYFTLAYLMSWIIWFPLYSPAFGVDVMPVLPFHHGIGGLGPMMASLITTWLFEGEKGMKKLAGQMVKIRPLLYIAIALFAPFLLAMIAIIINNLLNNQPVELSGIFIAKEFPEFNFIGLMLYNLFFFGFGEEAGWRGFALPRLQTRYNALRSSLILTLFWALWHWPLFMYRPGFMDMGMAGSFGWVFSLFTGSVLLTWLYNSSKGSILVCAIFHSTIDIAFLADFTDQNIINYMGMLITVWGIVTIIIFKQKNLSGTERIKR
jgi:membrane protease YdiL (CAAX protease family)